MYTFHYNVPTLTSAVLCVILVLKLVSNISILFEVVCELLMYIYRIPTLR